MRVDLKSFFGGVVLVTILFIVIGQTTKQSHPAGRFQIFMPREQPGMTFLLDTKTGFTCKEYVQRSEDGKIVDMGWTWFPMEDTMSEKMWRLMLQNY